MSYDYHPSAAIYPSRPIKTFATASETIHSQILMSL